MRDAARRLRWPSGFGYAKGKRRRKGIRVDDAGCTILRALFLRGRRCGVQILRARRRTVGKARFRDLETDHLPTAEGPSPKPSKGPSLGSPRARLRERLRAVDKTVEGAVARNVEGPSRDRPRPPPGPSMGPSTTPSPGPSMASSGLAMASSGLSPGQCLDLSLALSGALVWEHTKPVSSLQKALPKGWPLARCGAAACPSKRPRKRPRRGLDCQRGLARPSGLVGVSNTRARMVLHEPLRAHIPNGIP
mmetsp:Transcript_23218/g.78424  ORF Transcript_23218/g.78424 Transcript_23218/m.78424 type:complete len:249 (-) Transcript_23218:146-892(-)